MEENSSGFRHSSGSISQYIIYLLYSLVLFEYNTVLYKLIKYLYMYSTRV
jgi:hypothetical protein